MIFLTSDTHFGHKRICELARRPFKSIDEHDAKLIENWNSVIKQDDSVYHLGDIGLCPKDRLRDILYKLNGDIHLIRGNHDRDVESFGIVERFRFVKDMYILKIKTGGNKIYIVLCHYAMRRWKNSHQGYWHLYGHSHGDLLEKPFLSFDVGVDCWNYTPVSLDKIIEKMVRKLDLGHGPTEHHKPNKIE